MSKRISIAGLVGIAALSFACGGGDDKEFQYGEAQAPTVTESSAAAEAQAALAGTFTFAPSTEPTLGAPGLADQLATYLGAGGSVYVALPTAPAAHASSRSDAMVIDAGGIDPACVTVTATSATWDRCVVTFSDVDPVTGDSTEMTVTVNGTMGWNAATGTTTWALVETAVMTMTTDGDTMQLDATVRLDGSVTTTATAIVGRATSTVTSTASFMGLTMAQAYGTSLDLDLDIQADPFCITGGTLTLQRVWSQRPYGATPAALPDLAWRFEWTGCGQFTVSHGF